MTPQALEYIKGRLNDAGLNYHFLRYNYGKGSPVYPYSVGTYYEREAETEDGMQDMAFTLNVWTRGEWSELEEYKAKVKALFPATGCTALLPGGSGVAVSYTSAQPIPTGDATLKRIEITLDIKEWSV